MKKTMELKFERTLEASPAEAFDAWLNPETPGTTWHEHKKLVLQPKVDGLFYWLYEDTAHFGRFTEMKRPSRLQYTWMSRYTSGEESTVTVTFEPKGKQTLMTLVHSDLPDDEKAKAHEGGWNFFLDKLVTTFKGSR